MKVHFRSDGTKYIIFLAVNVPLIIFFLLSRWIFSGSSFSLNYNTRVGLTEYAVKVAYASLNTDTGEMECIIFYNNQSSALSNCASEPEIFSIASSSDLDSFIEYQSEEITSNIIKIKAFDLPDDFDYIRIFLQSTTADVVVPDSYDNFGDVIHGYTIKGETEFLEIRIDVNDFVYLTNEQAATYTLPAFNISDELVDSEPDEQTTTTSVPLESITEPTEETEETEPELTTTEPELNVTTTAPEVTAPEQTTTVATVTEKTTSKTTTTTAKTTTKATTTTKKTTTTTKATTTTPKATTTTTAIGGVIRGLKIACPIAVDGIITLGIGDTAQLTPVFIPEGAYTSVVWTSKKPDVVTVDAGGKVTAISKGTTIIKCTTSDGSFEVGIMVTIK